MMSNRCIQNRPQQPCDQVLATCGGVILATAFSLTAAAYHPPFDICIGVSTAISGITRLPKTTFDFLIAIELELVWLD
jgi:hypothetical protein